MSENKAAASAANELVITRTFDAPRDLVFQVWTDEKHLKHWWGPTGFTFTSAKLDLRPGGIFHYSMVSPEGDVLWGKFTFYEIEAPEKLVFANSFSDPEGNTVRPPFSESFPLEVMNSFTFAEQDGRTIITMRGRPYNATEEEVRFFGSMHESMHLGFGGTFDQLDAYLASL
ncbi:SRPBCC domain-containing protein [Paenibacillus allorhizosphaerae]|uniref:Activator of Hsp90 ATPase homologue 1/2-like C-terminal domain-containing protein n=1 Tax=Paenibacillus allorhizosphaerae TaxID=2849866 RepID=A0ABN7TM43_9BACL|nr:SRPBCC domain-containing protein [Paenibacillus allorhizosphaerae]CAG7646590.1 hypothetical protein PAECIP111802_03784 [Paenibacillus allorhizosphaerae]